MDELKALSKNAFDWLNAKDPPQWSKSHFSPRSKSDILLSNLSKCFNKMILEARDKPILTLMEMIYSHFIQPMRDPNQWVKNTSCEPVIEPKLRRPPGKPKKKRVKEAGEAQNSSAKWTKKGLTMYCSKCKKPGHNQRTWKGEFGSNQKRTTTQTSGPSVSHSYIRTSKLQVRRATTLSLPPVMPTTSASPHVMATSSSPPVMPTTSESPQISTFVFIPIPGNGMRVRWMQSLHADVNGGQQLSQSSTITQNSQEESNPFVPPKKTKDGLDYF
ncbi:hypothetical protein V6N13_110501 [Hibiscus sabdariffa]